MRLLRLSASWCALLATGSLLTGCAGSSGTSTPSATPQTAVPISKAQAVAYARAVNLRAGDVSGMTIETPEGEAPAPKHSAFEFARCYGGVSPARRTVKIHSPEFSAGRAAQSKLVESSIEVWPTPGLAARNNATYLSSRGRGCFVRFQEAFNKQLNRQRGGQLQYGPPTVVMEPNPLPRVSQSFLRTIAQPLLRGGQIRLRIYHDIFTFISGPAEIELKATGFARPVPAATEERLLSLLLSRAQEHRL